MITLRYQSPFETIELQEGETAQSRSPVGRLCLSSIPDEMIVNDEQVSPTDDKTVDCSGTIRISIRDEEQWHQYSVQPIYPLMEEKDARAYRNKETDNSRNGHSSKTLKTSFGEVEVSVPRDRKGEFEPQLLKKHQTSISQDIEEKILSMYAKGMTTSDIEAHIRDIYGLEVSDTTISRITDKILPIVREWQNRPLESVYAVVFMDAIHYHVRSEGQIVKKAVYIAIGINLDGRKDVLGMWVGENESAKFWATVLNGMRNRGVQDIFIACTDNLTGFSAAINAIFPQTDVQNCIIHQLRNSSKYVSYKDIKNLMADLKAVYAAADEQAALSALDEFEEIWGKKYPRIAASWRENWANLSTYFKFPDAVRRLIYTTNTIEGFNRQLRKVTKSKSVFPTDDSLLKMLYLAMMDITKKWTGRRTDWSIIHAQLLIYYGNRMPE